MDILVVGAGPAGLIFASEMKKLRPDWRLRIVEKNDRDHIEGLGVVLPGPPGQHPANALSYLDDSSPLQPQSLDEFRLVYDNEPTLMKIGVPLCSVGRGGLVQALRDKCQKMNIPIDYGFSLSTSSQLPFDSHDLIVVANGINQKNAYLTETLAPQQEYGSNKYIWYGTRHRFDELSLVFRPHEAGIFIGHAYKYSNDLSTFIVECTDATYAQAELSQMSEKQTAEYLAPIFADQLNGQPLLLQPGRGWRQFLTLSHRHSFHRNMVLIGDALQSGHFSIGHGTTMAVIEALVLVKSLHADPQVERALPIFDGRITPLAHLFRRHANDSRRWFETIESRMTSGKETLVNSFDERRRALMPFQDILAETLSYALDR